MAESLQQSEINKTVASFTVDFTLDSQTQRPRLLDA